jgi:ABC-type uncharacterized transport system ATPase subunit
MPLAVEMRNIVKQFPGVVANDNVNLEVRQGEIHGLLGENGAGKTTLMNVLYGLYHPDAGQILIEGEEVTFQSPREAIAAGIGMVHQHFMLIPVFTVVENLVLGDEPVRGGITLDIERAEKGVRELSEQYGLMVDPAARVEDISVGIQQRVEILKALQRGARTMILDEPSAVLTPQEVEELYAVMEQLRADGRTFIFISHKLHEVLRITDRVTVLRDGKAIGTVNTAETNERELARMMVGRDVVLRVQKTRATPGEPVLRVENLSANDYRDLPAVCGVSFEVKTGEIVGIAGIEGNGQTELIEVLTGLRPPQDGRVFLDGQDVTGQPPARLFHQGMAHIPEDRHRRGLILDFTIAENVVLGYQDDPPFARGPRLLMRKVFEFAQQVVSKFDVRTPDIRLHADTLSGGNQQKLIVGREFERHPRVLIAAQPTRGLDVGAIEFVHRQLVGERDAGKGVLLISLELSEIMSLSDRILVMYNGEIVGTTTAEEATEETLGLMMAGGGTNTNG